jgi:hypothetical protein
MRNATVFVCLLLLGFLLGMPSPALAFQVEQWFNGYLGQPIHEQITRDALTAYQVDDIKSGFDKNYAIPAIVQANANTDRNQEETSWHFDGEDFSGGSKRLIDLKAKLIDEVKIQLNKEPDQRSTQKSYEYLGGALHTVQDFYAHSNWVELENRNNKGNPTINRELGRGPISNVADPETPTCPTNSSTLGGEGLEKVTSGYYNGSTSCSLPVGIKQGKCIHGPILFNSSCPGINKDKPGRSGYDTASELAFKATQDYLDQILKDKDSPLAGNVDAAKFLMRIRK